MLLRCVVWGYGDDTSGAVMNWCLTDESAPKFVWPSPHTFACRHMPRGLRLPGRREGGGGVNRLVIRGVARGARKWGWWCQGDLSIASCADTSCIHCTNPTLPDLWGAHLGTERVRWEAPQGRQTGAEYPIYIGVAGWSVNELTHIIEM